MRQVRGRHGKSLCFLPRIFGPASSRHPGSEPPPHQPCLPRASRTSHMVHVGTAGSCGSRPAWRRLGSEPPPHQPCLPLAAYILVLNLTHETHGFMWASQALVGAVQPGSELHLFWARTHLQATKVGGTRTQLQVSQEVGAPPWDTHMCSSKWACMQMDSCA